MKIRRLTLIITITDFEEIKWEFTATTSSNRPNFDKFLCFPLFYSLFTIPPIPLEVSWKYFSGKWTRLWRIFPTCFRVLISCFSVDRWISTNNITCFDGKTNSLSLFFLLCCFATSRLSLLNYKRHCYEYNTSFLLHYDGAYDHKDQIKNCTHSVCSSFKLK